MGAAPYDHKAGGIGEFFVEEVSEIAEGRELELLFDFFTVVEVYGYCEMIHGRCFRA